MDQQVQLDLTWNLSWTVTSLPTFGDVVDPVNKSGPHVEDGHGQDEDRRQPRPGDGAQVTGPEGGAPYMLA